MEKLSYKLIATLLLSSLMLVGCETMSPNNPFASDYGDNRAQPNNYNYSGGSYSRGVSVPDSYHFSGNASPQKHTSRDANWVNEQNPNAYTIELATDNKPAPVAKVLHETPKQERTAQIKRNQNGETVYTGVYGTYDSRESAEKALSNLPPEVRDKATVESWGNIQRSTAPSAPARTGPPSMRSSAPTTSPATSSTTSPATSPAASPNSGTRFDPLQNLDM